PWSSAWSVTAHPPAGRPALVEIGEAVRAGMASLACVSDLATRPARAVALVESTSEGSIQVKDCHCHKQGASYRNRRHGTSRLDFFGNLIVTDRGKSRYPGSVAPSRRNPRRSKRHARAEHW